MAAFPKDGPWLGLLQHFLQCCGPQDMRAAVDKMLTEANAERPIRTLRQRVSAVKLAWELAQDTFCGVHPEYDNWNERLEPCRCTPFISIYTQTKTLKTLVMNTDKALWQVYSTRPEYRVTKDNPVPLLR